MNCSMDTGTDVPHTFLVVYEVDSYTIESTPEKVEESCCHAVRSRRAKVFDLTANKQMVYTGGFGPEWKEIEMRT